MRENPILYVVVPCYNEEEVLEETTKQLAKKMTSLIEEDIISKKSKVMYVNDGSKDKTWKLIKRINEENELFNGSETGSINGATTGGVSPESLTGEGAYDIVKYAKDKVGKLVYSNSIRDIENANSQVLLFSIKNKNILFMGDATCETEKSIIKNIQDIEDIKLKL